MEVGLPTPQHALAQPDVGGVHQVAQCLRERPLIIDPDVDGAGGQRRCPLDRRVPARSTVVQASRRPAGLSARRSLRPESGDPAHARPTASRRPRSPAIPGLRSTKGHRCPSQRSRHRASPRPTDRTRRTARHASPARQTARARPRAQIWSPTDVPTPKAAAAASMCRYRAGAHTGAMPVETAAEPSGITSSTTTTEPIPAPLSRAVERPGAGRADGVGSGRSGSPAGPGVAITRHGPGRPGPRGRPGVAPGAELALRPAPARPPCTSA